MLRPGILATKFKSLATSWPALVCLIAAILVWRCSSHLLHPELRAEDGSKVFAFFYTHRALSSLLRFKAGYLPLVPNVLGFLAVRLPARATPYVLTIVPTLLALVTFSVFRASAYRRYVHSDGLRFSVCLALAIAPIGNQLTVCNTDYCIWNVLLLLLLLVILPMPRSRAWAVLFSLTSAVLIWSHPLTLLALPATLFWLWRDTGVFKRALHALLLLCQGLHVRFGTEPQRATLVKTEPAAHRLAVLAKSIVNYICGEIIQPLVFPWGARTAGFVFALGGVFFVALVACALLRKARVAQPALYAWLGYGIWAPMALTALVRDERTVQSMRYYYVSKAFTAVALCLVLYQLLFSLTRRWAPKFRWLEVVPAVATLFYFALVNDATNGNARYQSADPANAALVARFFSDLADAERKQGGHCNINLRCRKGHGDWPFAVDTRRQCVEGSGVTD